jgi:hypothetical protein
MGVIQDGAVARQRTNAAVMEAAEGYGFQETGEAINLCLSVTLWSYRRSSQQPAFFSQTPAWEVGRRCGTWRTRGVYEYTEGIWLPYVLIVPQLQH